MINLRYHIVSITAVFLALGIGLTLGSTFLDRVTVDRLKVQLDQVQDNVRKTQAENEELRSALDGANERDATMSEELGERVVAGSLTDVPVVVVAADGTDEELVTRSVEVLAGAGADVAGIWWLTERWALDDSDEIADLGDVLEVSSDDPERLRRNGAIRLADALLASADAPEATPSGEQPADPDQADAEGATAEQPAEPEVAARLEESGFVDYTPGPGSGDRVILPPAGLRVVLVSSTVAGTGPELLSVALADELTADGPVPLIAAQGDVPFETENGDLAPEADRRTTFVGALRTGELTRDRVTTIDTLDTTAGLLALVLAVDDAGELRVGHYGVATGATRLLPGTDADR